MDLGSQIRQLRTSQGITQAELAFRIGVAPPLLCQWERNVKTPRLDNLEAVVNALGLRLSEFFRNVEDRVR